MRKFVLVLGFLLVSGASYGQDTEEFNALYQRFASASRAERGAAGGEIVQWLDNAGFGVGSLFDDNTLTDREFEIKVLDWTIRYLFRFEFYHSTISGAYELLRLAEIAADNQALIIGNYFLGFANQRLGNMDRGLLYAQACYDLCVAAGDEEMTSSVLNNIGNIYMVNGQDDMAIYYFQQSLDIERKLDRKANQAIRLGNMATCYMKLNMFDEALASALEGLELDLVYSGRADRIAIRYYQAGEVYTAMGNFANAKDHLLNALGYFETAGSGYGQANVLNALGELEMQQGNNQRAIEYLYRALAFAENIGNNLLIQQICHNLYSSHRHANAALSLQYFERSVALKDSLFHADNQTQLNDFRVRYETAERELEIAQQRAVIERQRVVRNISFATIGGFLLVIGLLVANVRLRIKRNKALTKLNNTLVETDAAKNKLFSIISHDLKNPAVAQRNVMLALLENSRDWDFERLSAYYRKILKSTNEFLDLLFTLLSWAQMQSGRMTYNPDFFDLADCLNYEADIVRNMAENKGVALALNMPATAYITGDRNILATVVRNLMTNAVKFTEKGGKVELRTAQAMNANIITVSVTDTGIGMSGEQIEHLFKLNSGKSKKGTDGEHGNGLGLIVCKELLEMHSSELNVESEVGKGSRFWFEVGV